MKKLFLILMLLMVVPLYGQFNALRPPPYLSLKTDTMTVKKVTRGASFNVINPSNYDSWYYGDTMYVRIAGETFRWVLTNNIAGRVLSFDGRYIKWVDPFSSTDSIRISSDANYPYVSFYEAGGGLYAKIGLNGYGALAVTAPLNMASKSNWAGIIGDHWRDYDTTKWWGYEGMIGFSLKKPTIGQIPKWNGRAYVPSTDSGSNSGGTMTGTQINDSLNNAARTINKDRTFSSIAFFDSTTAFAEAVIFGGTPAFNNHTPFSVAYSTLITNLNAQYLQGYTPSVTAGANRIPVANALGKIAQAYLPTGSDSVRIAYYSVSAETTTYIDVRGTPGSGKYITWNTDSSWYEWGTPASYDSTRAAYIADTTKHLPLNLAKRDSANNWTASNTFNSTVNIVNTTGTAALNVSFPNIVNTNLNADLLDSRHASGTPTALTIPISLATGHLDSNWIPHNFNIILNDVTLRNLSLSGSTFSTAGVLFTDAGDVMSAGMGAAGTVLKSNGTVPSFSKVDSNDIADNSIPTTKLLASDVIQVGLVPGRILYAVDTNTISSTASGYTMVDTTQPNHFTTVPELGNYVKDGTKLGTTTPIPSSSLANSGVTAGTYTNPTVTVDAKGLVNSIANGTGGTGSGNVTSDENVFGDAATYDTVAIAGASSFDNYSWNVIPFAGIQPLTMKSLYIYPDTNRFIAMRDEVDDGALYYSWTKNVGTFYTALNTNGVSLSNTSIRVTWTNVSQRVTDSIVVCWSDAAYPATIPATNRHFLAKTRTDDTLTGLTAGVRYSISVKYYSIADEITALSTGSQDTCTTAGTAALLVNADSVAAWNLIGHWAGRFETDTDGDTIGVIHDQKGNHNLTPLYTGTGFAARFISNAQNSRAGFNMKSIGHTGDSTTTPYINNGVAAHFSDDDSALTMIEVVRYDSVIAPGTNVQKYIWSMGRSSGGDDNLASGLNYYDNGPSTPRPAICFKVCDNTWACDIAGDQILITDTLTRYNIIRTVWNGGGNTVTIYVNGNQRNSASLFERARVHDLFTIGALRFDQGMMNTVPHSWTERMLYGSAMSNTDCAILEAQLRSVYATP